MKKGECWKKEKALEENTRSGPLYRAQEEEPPNRTRVSTPPPPTCVEAEEATAEASVECLC